MKNLILSTIRAKQICLQSPQFVVNSFDENEEIYTCNNLTVSKFKGNILNRIEINLQSHVPIGDDAMVINMVYLSLQRSLSLAVSTGEILNLNCDTLEAEVSGVCDSGLQAMEWSPDQEFVVLVTKTNSMVLMSCMFDPMVEVNLIEDVFGEGAFVTVGWGKKETQFHGTAGKQAAKSNPDDIVYDHCKYNGQSAKITWRGDGLLFAVGFMADSIRRFKVFDRDGILQFTSEKQTGLESNIAWKPSGSLIATTQVHPNKYVVAFFEKNGLKHGEFLLPFDCKMVTVKSLCWSNDSEVLALHCENVNEESSNILLYTASNYHWYLKQSLSYTKECNISKVFWDVSDDLNSCKRLHVFLKNGHCYIYTWNWIVNHSLGYGQDNMAIVAVIDGPKLLLTGFRHTVVPPPMAAFELHLKNAINKVIFGPITSNIWGPNDLCVLLDNGDLEFYRMVNEMPLKYEPFGLVKINVEELPSPILNNHFLWMSDNVIMYSYSNLNGCRLIVGQINIGDNFTFQILAEHSLEMNILDMKQLPETDNEALLQLSDGSIVKFSIESEITPYNISLPSPCNRMELRAIDNKIYVMGLSSRNVFFINQKEVAKNITSFCLHSDFLLLTTLQNELLCTELSEAGLDSLSSDLNSYISHVSKRKLERGSRLVVVVPHDTRAVMQLPRGNLEVIQPRNISLKIIGKYINEHQYNSAFDLMRKQRINLNLLYDHNPSDFLANADLFVNEIQNNSWLSLFLSDLDNVDITTTMYATSYAERGGKGACIDNEKIAKICNAIRNSLEKCENKHEKVLPILTSYVKTNCITDLEKALLIIKVIKEKEKLREHNGVSSDEALRYLLYIVDVNNLYDVALGLYDFDLVLLVANKSQKDPKEFLPMLNELNEMEEFYKQFTINKHLKRYKLAVECLVKCGGSYHQELRNFVKAHGLYSDALCLLTNQETIYREIAEDFAFNLRLNKYYSEAGFMYKRGGHLEKAAECFKEALDWELAIQLADGLNWSADRFSTFCWDIASQLKEAKRYTDAVYVLEKYHSDKELAIQCALECRHYKTALRLCHDYGQPDSVDKYIKKAINDDLTNLMETINMNRTAFTKHCSRLETVRKEKAKRANMMLTNLNEGNYVDSDLYSDTSSIMASTASRSSNRSFRSSKNRRKHERKLISLKEGSQYEDVALITALHSLVQTSFELRTHTREIVCTLYWLNRDEEAVSIQTNLENLLREMKEQFKNIWTNDLILEATKLTMESVPEPGEKPVLQGLASLDSALRIAPIIPDMNWKLTGL